MPDFTETVVVTQQEGDVWQHDPQPPHAEGFTFALNAEQYGFTNGPPGDENYTASVYRLGFAGPPFFRVLDWVVLSGAVATVNVNGAPTTFTEGVQWSAATSEAATAASLAAAITAGLIGVTASSVGGNVYLVQSQNATTITIASSNAALALKKQPSVVLHWETRVYNGAMSGDHSRDSEFHIIAEDENGNAHRIFHSALPHDGQERGSGVGWMGKDFTWFPYNGGEPVLALHTDAKRLALLAGAVLVGAVNNAPLLAGTTAEGGLAYLLRLNTENRLQFEQPFYAAAEPRGASRAVSEVLGLNLQDGDIIDLAQGGGVDGSLRGHFAVAIPSGELKSGVQNNSDAEYAAAVDEIATQYTRSAYTRYASLIANKAWSAGIHGTDAHRYKICAGPNLVGVPALSIDRDTNQVTVAGLRVSADVDFSGLPTIQPLQAGYLWVDTANGNVVKRT